MMEMWHLLVYAARALTLTRSLDGYMGTDDSSVCITLPLKSLDTSVVSIQLFCFPYISHKHVRNYWHAFRWQFTHWYFAPVKKGSKAVERHLY